MTNKSRTKPKVKSSKKTNKIPKLGYGQTSRNINTLRKIEKANHDQQPESYQFRYTENGERYYTSAEVSALYSKLTTKKKNEVLYDAIDYMGQFNGRSRFDCIALAMGFRDYEGDGKSYFKPKN
jgi:hypothetical protein